MMREIKIRAEPDKACFFEPDSVPTRDKERKNHGLRGLRGLGFLNTNYHELNEFKRNYDRL